ncbi:MAG: hypothetical protein HOM68_03290 [Gemmatimonadetes bacterium]|jgi:hypothetical protein|nr:hypothetical protein [Gemmatimonadota bacterium]MBT5141827.1 hypothetical protein [Gemmatimonadota bacterium]MBT5588669.1 hypothetical protein [Gemmatimonadota bacterium]MBT5962537.1 hypothetical protein [Gemmatimonadota bacterium]MBT7455265.1 hypothetical protein [Gemmatimonadota bacterium]
MQIRTSRRGSLVIRAGITATCLLMAACATTTGGGHGPAPIPEGMGRLIIEAGGIRKLNYYIVDQDTDEEVFADHPRSAGSSPIGFESGSRATNLVQDMPPGLYTVVVLTDIEDFVRVRDVEVVMGEPRYATPQVGRFMLRVLADNARSSSGAVQLPFLITDYNMRTVLGKGMTSTEVRHFIVPAGRTYKVRIENSPTGRDEIREVEVHFGGLTHIEIDGRTPDEQLQGGDDAPN